MSLFRRLFKTIPNGTSKNEIDAIKLAHNASLFNSKINNFIYNDTTTHPLINQINKCLMKFMTTTNSIISSCENFYYCKTNMVSLLRLGLYRSLIKILIEYILPNNIKPIKCFNLTKIDDVNIDNMYYNHTLMSFFKIFTRNIVKYHSIKISKCLQDGEITQAERLTFVFNQFIAGFYMITEQLNGINISCKDLVKQVSDQSTYKLNPMISSNCELITNKYIRIYVSDIMNMYDAISRDIISALKLLIPNNILIIFDFDLFTIPVTEEDVYAKTAIEKCPNILNIIDTAKLIGKKVYAINHQHVDLSNVIPKEDWLSNEEEMYTLIYLWKANGYTEIPLDGDIVNNIDKASIYKLNKNINKMKYVIHQMFATR